jgi:hypothetical protein
MYKQRSDFAKSKEGTKKTKSNSNLNGSTKNDLKHLKKNEKNENVLRKTSSLPAIGKPQQQLKSATNLNASAKTTPIANMNMNTQNEINLDAYGGILTWSVLTMTNEGLNEGLYVDKYVYMQLCI